MSSLTSTCANGCRIEELVSQTINDVDVQTVYDNAIRLQDEFIPSTVKFSRLTANAIDTLSLSNHLLVDGDIEFQGVFQADGGVSIAANLSVAGLVDGKIISPSELLLAKGNQEIKGKVFNT